MGNPVVHFEIQTKNPGKVQKFYSDLCGWKVDTNNPQNYGIVDTASDGKGINGGIGSTPRPTNMVTFYIHADDPAAFLKKAEGLGGKTVMPATDIMPGLTIGMLTDPDGNTVGVVKGM